MNIPNFLTILRILSIPLFIILLSYGFYPLALLLFFCAGVTDALDGFLARTFKQKTTLGAYLDPIADKLLLSSSFVAFSILKLMPVWLTILVISRDVIILGGILVLLVNSFSISINPTIISKCTTTLQLLTIGLTLLFQVMQNKYIPLHLVYWITGLFTIISGIDYVRRGIRLINERERN
ncbi:MAG: CDP-diacylglycerol--glycerol-3-phosphate 3-phosphatidyltransferase [Proteobacteria bacterium]|jgi:cardiolipin synthase (CMP-forming)|nr:CDP-diacylglycerol--glycerol-3-phosphate 3-phosphatidyltransferase [Pseudomonadota bacterium]